MENRGYGKIETTVLALLIFCILYGLSYSLKQAKTAKHFSSSDSLISVALIKSKVINNLSNIKNWSEKTYITQLKKSFDFYAYNYLIKDYQIFSKGSDKVGESFTDCPRSLGGCSQVFFDNNARISNRGNFKASIFILNDLAELTADSLPDFAVKIFQKKNNKVLELDSFFVTQNAPKDNKDNINSASILGGSNKSPSYDMRVACYKDFQNKSLAAPKVAIQVCQGATSQFPQDCFAQGKSLKATNSTLISLCKEAQSSGPYICFYRIIKRNRKFPRIAAAQICAASSSTDGSQCVELLKKYLKGDKLHNGALKICAQTQALEAAGCFAAIAKKSPKSLDYAEDLCKKTFRL